METEIITGNMFFSGIVYWFKSGRFFGSVLVFAVAVAAWFLLKKISKLSTSLGRSIKFKTVVIDVAKWVIALLAIALILEVNGVDVSSFLAGLGLVSVIIGLALQDFLKDIIMGIHIMTDGFYTEGDAVVFDGKDCIVTDFTLKTTKLRVIADGSSIVVCNRNIDKVTRMSDMVDIDIPLSYDDDLAKIRNAMNRIASVVSQMNGVEGAFFKGTQEFGDSAVYYKLRFFCEPAKQHQMKRDVRGIIQDILAEEGLAIPFNQLDIHTKE